jgi:hypothetical protein
MKTSPPAAPPRWTEKLIARAVPDAESGERSGPTLTVVRCNGCGAELSDDAWRELALVQRVTSEELRRFLVRWPTGASLEIRRCRHCGKNIARKERA